MPRLPRFTALGSALLMILAACSSPGGPADGPGNGGGDESTAASTDATVTLSTDSGVELTFDVDSCTSPGSNVINLQGSNADSQLDMRASVTGTATITGATELVGEIEELSVADDGTVTASGSIVTEDGSAVDDFILTGTCPDS